MQDNNVTDVPRAAPTGTILDEAQYIVRGDRNQDYGTATESFARIAQVATMITGKYLTGEDCCKILMAVKLVRQSYKPKRDNLVDLAGYTLILDELVEDRLAQVPMA